MTVTQRTGTKWSGTNWSGNVHFSSVPVLPQTIEQVQDIVAASRSVKVLGSRHSFTPIADGRDVLISLDELPANIAIDAARHTVSVGAGVRFGELAHALHDAGCALANMASLPHITLAGAYATGTHGSGNANGVLASSIRSLDVVTGGGEMVTIDRNTNPDWFAGAAVSLGALGVITSFTVDVVPTFDVAQHVYEGLTFAAFADHFDELAASAYSVSMFTDWTAAAFTSVWCKARVGDASRHCHGEPLFGATPSLADLHPLTGHDAVHCTEQHGIAGPWHHRLPHFRYDFTPSSGQELQTEYLMPRHHAVEAFAALVPLQERIADMVMVNEVRTVAADDFWLSPSSQRDSVAFHFTWRPDESAVRALLPLIEERLAPFDPRPHWGKLFAMAPVDVRASYPNINKFQSLARHLDPNEKFTNSYLDTLVFGA
jgi:alditol oxidase